MTIGEPLMIVDAMTAMQGISQETRRAYCRWIAECISTINQGFTVDLAALNVGMVQSSLSVATLKAWLGKLKARNLGKQSLKQAKSAMVWLAQFFADLGYVDYGLPAGMSRVPVPRAEIGQHAGRWLSVEQLKMLIIASRHVGRSKRTRVRNETIIVLMVACGLRRDEVVRAKWKDITMQGNHAVLNVHGKGEKLRTIKLPQIVVKALDNWRRYHHEPSGVQPIFLRAVEPTSTLSPKAIWNLVVQVAEAAGLSFVSPHDLRRSFARGAYEAGVSFELIRQTLGHSRIETTEKYVNSALELGRAATDIFSEVLEAGEEKMIDVSKLPKECNCVTHDVPHWLHEDRSQAELNVGILARGGKLSSYAFAKAEIIRLQTKAAVMQQILNSGGSEPFIWPDGYSEHDYNAMALAVLKEAKGR